MKVLITGGTGFIGIHIAAELLAAGHRPVLIDDFSNSSPIRLAALAGLVRQATQCVRGDIRDGDCLDRALEDVDAVVHLASPRAIGESVEQPTLYYESILSGTAGLLKRMAHHGVRSLVFGSTAAVYRSVPVPITEDAPKAPASPYARAKLAAEEMLRDLQAADPRWSVSVLRCFNAAGAHPSGRMGESVANPPDNLLPRIAEIANGRGPWLDVFGDDYPTPDGTCIRDYIHVLDLARAYVRALECLGGSSRVTVYNLGTGHGHSVLEVIRAFERASGRTIPHRVADRRLGDVARLEADATRAKIDLGWTAERGLEAICADVWRWCLS